MTVLVAYGTTGGSTGEIAEWIGEALRVSGLTVEVRPAADVEEIDGYEAIVLGGALYAAGWHRDARQFVHRFAGAPELPPAWLFSSGPLDSSADESEPAPGPQVSEAMRMLNAREHVTFGGRLTSHARGWLGFVARRLELEGCGGDFRNPKRVRAWARQIAVDLHHEV